MNRQEQLITQSVQKLIERFGQDISELLLDALQTVIDVAEMGL